MPKPIYTGPVKNFYYQFKFDFYKMIENLHVFENFEPGYALADDSKIAI